MGTIKNISQSKIGQLGDGTTTGTNSPVQIETEQKWSAIATGSTHTIAIKSDRTLWTWGYNFYGQLGRSCSGTQCYSPGQVGSDNNWVAVAAGYHYSIGLKFEGTLYTWGFNDQGQLGLGDTVTEIPLPRW